MSDTRRRRKSNQSCGSDDLSDSCEELNATKETQSSEQTDGHQDSECDIYESGGSDTESQEGGLRESGDGQEEEKPEKKLDDDEDRRNPQYIPKRGTFYEHDDRTTDEVPDTTTETQNERETKEKKVWKDKEDKWGHDRYNDEEQAPKSHEELIAVYGYDIRNEEGPPRARRRRRYGRGPNKYTRNWEDEDAYGKTGTTVTPGKGSRRFNRSSEDFPALGTNKAAPAQVEEPVISSAWYSSKNKSQNKVQNFPPLQSQHEGQKSKSITTTNVHTNENKAPNESANPTWKKDTKLVTHNQSTNGNNGPGGDADKLVSTTKISPRDSNKRNVQESVSLAASRTRGRGFKANPNNNMVTNRTVEIKPKGRGAGPIITDNRRNNTVQQDEDQQLAHDIKHMNANDSTQYHQSGRHNKSFYAQSPNQQRSNTIPPRLQQQQSHQQQAQQGHQQQQTIQQQQDGSGNRPKRYSSLRQRPTIPETPGQQNYPAQHGQHGYFPPQAGNSRGILESQAYPPGHFEQSPQVAAPTPPMAGQPVIPLPPSGQPTSYAPPPFLVPPPQFIPPQGAPTSIINYVPGPNGPAFQPNYQSYQGYNPPVQPPGPPPPQELFQPQGCTYYSTAQQQQQQQQTAPMRRPKAAIPILPPPDNQQHQTSRGRGKSIQHQQSNFPGYAQQTEQEVKNNTVEGELNTVSGQFDNIEPEQVVDVQHLEKDEILNSNSVEDKEESISNIIDVETRIENLAITPDCMDDPSEKETLESIIDDRDVISQKTVESISVKAEELPEIESSIPENTVMKEAAA